MKNITIECKECLYNSDHPFGLGLNDQYVCHGCIVHKEKFEIDWKVRLIELKKITNKYKSNNNYDCIVPLSGNIESFHILDIVINKLKLNPLGVNYNSGWNTEVGIRNLALIKNVFNIDIRQFNPNPEILKKMCKFAISNISSVYYPHLAGKYTFPVQIAVEHKVPLIIWGAHEGVEQTGMFSHNDYVEMSYRHFLDFHCMGLKTSNFSGPFETFNQRDLFRFNYPENDVIINNKIRGIYLSNYTLWDPLKQNKIAAEKYSAYVTKHLRSFDIYEHIDCHHYMGIHDEIKKKKLGYSKVYDQINREIRFKRINKSEAKKLVNYYDQQFDEKSKNMFLNWLGVNHGEFDFIINDNIKKTWDSKFWTMKKPKKLKKNYLINSKLDKYSNVDKKLFLEKGNKHLIYGKGV